MYKFSKLLDVITKHVVEAEGYWCFLNNFLYKENDNENKKQIELMYETFPNFFGYAQYAFWETFLLILCRLNDEDIMKISDRKTGETKEEREHCSFKMLMKEIKKADKLKRNDKAKKDIQKKLDDFGRSMKTGKLYRNRLIAHSDLRTYCECMKDGIITDKELRCSQEENLKAFLKAKDFFASVYEFFEDDEFILDNSNLNSEIDNLTQLLEKYRDDNTAKKHS
jgi:hypothetical protein